MGGKRPDQYQIDPGEAGATDYKTRDEDQGTREQDEQQVAAPIDQRPTESHIPKAGINPALQELREARARRDDSDDAQG